MNFLEKNLESIIFNDPEYCRSRGLDMDPMHFSTYRQLNLAPFGIADLVQIGYDAWEDVMRVRIIECKRNIVDASTYAQAARYQVAMHQIMKDACPRTSYEKVLIGQRVDAKNDFWYLVDTDPYCRVYTYEYLANGIHFKSWYDYGQIALDKQATIYQPTTKSVSDSVKYIRDKAHGARP